MTVSNMSQFVEIELRKRERRDSQSKERPRTPSSVRQIRDYLNWFELQSAAFRRLPPKLLKKHLGEFVALCHERVVDSDQSREKLLGRVQKRFKPQEIYIEQVVANRQRVVEINTMES
jgi:hypothetical protein